MKTTELSCDTHDGVIMVEGEFVRYRASDISEDSLTEFVNRTPLLQDFDTTLEKLKETFARIELSVVVAPDRSVAASLQVITDNIAGTEYAVPTTEDEKRKWAAAILTNICNKEKPLMQRFLEEGYPLEEMFFHQSENELYVYNTLLSTKVINEWCGDKGFNKEQRCAPYKGTVTGRQMYVCKLLSEDEKEASKMKIANNKKHKNKKHKHGNYER